MNFPLSGLNDYFKDSPESGSSDPLYDVMEYEDIESSEYYLD